jgi:hypothetical protein
MIEYVTTKCELKVIICVWDSKEMPENIDVRKKVKADSGIIYNHLSTFFCKNINEGESILLENVITDGIFSFEEESGLSDFEYCNCNIKLLDGIYSIFVIGFSRKVF